MSISVFGSNSAFFRAMGVPAEGVSAFTEPMDSDMDTGMEGNAIISGGEDGEDAFATFSRQFMLHLDVPPTGHIEAIKGTSDPDIDLTPFHGILERGIRNIEDIALLDKLYKLIDPDEAGRLADETAPIPHQVLESDSRRGKTGGRTAGGTERTFAHVVNRKRAGLAHSISFYTFGDSGTSVEVPVHERAHGARFEALSAIYSAIFPVADIPSKEAPLKAIFDAILNNLFWDEAMAFGASVRFVEKFKAVTGREPASFYKGESRTADALEAYRKAYAEGGYGGIYRAVADANFYLPYKFAALYVAILWKQGAMFFPSWDEIFTQLGARRADGGYELTLDSVGRFFNTFVRPHIGANPLDMAAMAFGAIKEGGGAFRDVLLYFTGAMPPQTAASFLKSRFDEVVLATAAIMGGTSAEEDGAKEAPARRSYRMLPPRPAPMRSGGSSNAAAEKTEITGKYVELLSKAFDFDDEVERIWADLLTYAETTDPASSAVVYSRLLDLVNRGSAGASEGIEESVVRQWRLGISLFRSGYTHEGRAVLDRAIIMLPENFFTSWISLETLIELGLDDIAESYVDRVISASKNAFERGDINTFSKINKVVIPNIVKTKTLKLPQNVQAKLDSLVRYMMSKLEGTMRSATEKFQNKDATKETKFKVRHGLKDQRDILLRACLKLPIFFRAGLAFLEGYPQGLEKVELYQLAAAHIPPDLNDEERRALAVAYSNALFLQEEGLKNWSFIENRMQQDGHRYSQMLRLSNPPQFRQSHFCMHHSFQIAKVLLGGRSAEVKEEGLEILRSLPNDGKVYADLFFDGDGSYVHFIPKLWRSLYFVASAGHFPEEEREGIIRNALDELRNVEAVNGNAYASFNDPFFVASSVVNLSVAIATGVVDAAISAARYGHNALAAQIVREWKDIRGALHDVVTSEIERYEGATNTNSEHSLLTSSWNDKVESRVRMILPLLEAVLRGGEGLSFLIDRVEYDIKNGRGYFTPAAMAEAMNTLGEHKRVNELERLSHARIDQFVAAVGDHRYDRQGMAHPIVEMIDSSVLPDAAKDRLLVHYIDSATPELGVSSRSFNTDSILMEGREGSFLIDTVVGNPRYPLAEERLLAKFAEISRKVKFNRKDYRYRGAMGGLRWVFSRVADEAFLPKTPFSLQSSSQTPDEIAANKEHYYSVLANDALGLEARRGAFDELAKTNLISSYAKDKQTELAKNGDEAREGSLYYFVQPVLMGQTALNSLMAYAMDRPVEDTVLFADALKRYRDSPSSGPKYKVDPASWHDYIINQFFVQTSREAFRGTLQKSFFFLSAINGGETDFSKERSELTSLRNAVVMEMRKRLKTAKAYSSLRDYLLRYIKGFEENTRVQEDSKILESLEETVQVLTRIPTIEEARELLDHLAEFWDQIIVAEDRVVASGSEMPALFRDREPLARFLMSRYFMQVEPGLQQVMLKAIRDAESPEDALRIFIEMSGLEKIGQSLSYWPEVPKETREELSHLQSNVAPSDLEEVRMRIENSLPEGVERDAILANLESKPLGSGSIGEAYRSRLSNGRPVAVKVITRSKEDRFRQAIRHIAEVRKIVGAYSAVSADEIPGMAAAAQLIDMFIGMVEGEFDLTVEAGSAEKMAAILPDGIKVPEYINGLVTPKVAVQSFASGTKLDKMPAQLREMTAQNIAQFFFAGQVLEHGFVHTDIQPGNVLVDANDGVATLLDFGQMLGLEASDRALVQEFIEASTAGDAEKLRTVLEKMSADEMSFYYSRNGLLQDVAEIVAVGADGGEKISDGIAKIFKACLKNKLYIREPFLKLLKGIATLEAAMGTPQ